MHYMLTDPKALFALFSQPSVEGLRYIHPLGRYVFLAAMTGDSLVVIPFQFSHCLRASSSGDSASPKLIRANFLLTGLVFHGDLDDTINYRQGPFVGIWCGLNDLREDRTALQSIK
jgi:hypothetical protein